MNLDLIERASLVIRSAIANAMDWGDIELLVKDYQARGDPVAMAIHGLKLKTNEITLLLRCIDVASTAIVSSLLKLTEIHLKIGKVTVMKKLRH